MAGLPRVRAGHGRIAVGERFAVSFERTLRVPEAGGTYPLPPSLGRFEVRPHEGGFAIAIHAREALWLGFEGATWKPNACIVLAGSINAVTGRAGDDGLDAAMQNYLVTPYQPWLDGFNAGDGVVRQFVAMRLGAGLTAEEAITGLAATGGLGVVVYEPEPGRFPDEPPPEPGRGSARVTADMGLGGGGEVRQRIYPDPHGTEVWDRDSAVRVRIALLDIREWRAITGEHAPPSPVTVDDYTRAGLPWFELYDDDRADVEAAPALKALPRTGVDEHHIDPADLPVRRIVAPASAGRRSQGENMTDIRVCIDRLIPVYGESGEELAAVIDKKWENGSTLKVRFLDGDTKLQARVVERAREWESYAHLHFGFGEHPDAEIRVAFVQDGSSWSAVGKDALNVDWFPPAAPTMNFGWLTPESSDEEVSRVVLHEFGHAIGCIHEHSSPEASLPWNKPAVYRYYAARGWSRDLVDNNVFRRYSQDQTQFTEYDTTSIMQYPVPRELTDGSFEIGLNTKLSDMDKEFAAELYPGATAKAN